MIVVWAVHLSLGDARGDRNPFWCRVLFFLLLLALPMQAHTISLTYAEVTVDENQVSWALKLPAPELDLLLGLDQNHDGQVDDSELAAAEPRVRKYVLSKLSVSGAAGNMGPMTLWKDAEGHPFAKTDVTFRAPDGGFAHATLRCDVLQDVVSTHQTIARILSPTGTVDFVFQNGRTYEVNASLSIADAAAQFVRMGVLHIFTGYDHIAFLIGVVLIGGSFSRLLKVVTSFTVAHSLTLGLAAFQLVHLPTRMVESGIALSIIYIAVENLFFHKFDRRWMVTFFFGLVHGFGFASALQEVHLTRHLLATALFSFNLGVEVGQVCIVAVLLPALFYLSRQRFNTVVVKGCSAVIFLLGSFWLWERIWQG